jgi:hypothetical protein
MDDVDPISGMGITLADILIENGVDRSGFVPVCSYRQQAAGFNYHDDIFVLVKDCKPFGLIFCRGVFRSGHGILLDSDSQGYSQ